MNQKVSMKADWDERSKENAYHWVDSTESQWNKEEYYAGGERDIQKYVLPLLQKKGVPEEQWKSIEVLDIGCGTGRLCRALSKYFGKVTGVDISEKMIAQAKQDNSDLHNVTFVQTSGEDLAQVPSASLDFCFSFIVFQHIPFKKVIRSYFREIERVLKPGGLAKVQVRGTPGNPPGKVVWFHGFSRFYIALVLWRQCIPLLWAHKYGTVYGACFSERQLRFLAKKSGFDVISTFHETERYLWVEMQKIS
ncbi:hypothetical protein COU78_01050 [Candidatus Peregrinibacteria bacterium CG10_big_fil_rev_8_21_14_0_10_49_24]|nr:MAG: hypothetical protein COV83_01300 [Candidatus Peregrinibacteria bacterium CG11_big_fil_rev_8_21_14_0_20_49_14]PIR51534.1 MAG: hypothetical protein COU78_01050 [Candidatus Peregrinibacteria bacterium CG10_big_fil_rev_8_21_14_0_10_49_24]PJA67822.1 MAG: hypothetical protein CO157_02290 [Candidatus Peregrinibacteria bacterium CG_4_9_14_3_um_filter_49_12]